MNLIQEVKITYFRSFSKTMHIKDFRDLNIFSGKNDSGKSNVLKAINLFFTEEYVDFYNYFDFNIDYSKARLQKSKVGKQKQTIKISILFNRVNFSGIILPEQFWVEKEWDRYGDLIGRKTKNKKGDLLNSTAQNRSTSQFLNKIHFMYIPAIKDSRFFSFLKTEYQQSLSEKLANETAAELGSKITIGEITTILSVKQITDLLGEKIDIEAERMMEHFLGNAKEVQISNFKIPDIDFSKVLEVITENDIPLTSRGDGVQAKFIPQILNEIARNKKAINIIWGFEEPENSYEYSNAQILAEKFRDEYANNKQIILTSHAFNFITLDGKNISLYRAWKPNLDEGTQITCLSNNKGLFQKCLSDELADELGIISLNLELEKAYQKTLVEIKNVESLKQQIKKHEKPILYVEDKYDQIYKISWLKLHDIDCSIDDFEEKFDAKSDFAIIRAEGVGNLQGFLTAKNIDFWKDRKVIGLFDFDDAGVKTFKSTKNHSNWKNKNKEGTVESGFYSQRKDSNFFALLLPIPKELQVFTDYNRINCIEIEHLLPKQFLNDNGFVTFEKIFDRDLISIISDKKPKIWKKVIELEKDDFINFSPLFITINEIFGLQNENYDKETNF